MKLLLLFGLGLLYLANANGQKKNTFFVEYFYTQNSVIFPDSVKNKKIDVEVQYTNSNKHEIIETTTGDLLPGGIHFETIFFILANSDSSKMFFANVESPNTVVRLTVSTPDTIFYSRGFWIKTSDGIPETLSPISVSVIETKETKNILGYECIKFTSMDSQKHDEVTFWACKDLPNTLLPYTGLKEFKYGILEIEHFKNKWHTKATKIEKF